MRRSEWRQATPHDELTVVLMALWGNAENAKNGIAVERSLDRILEHCEELHALKPFLKDPDRWPA